MMKTLIFGLTLAAVCSPALAQVRGSYLGSCTSVRQRGPILEAMCEDRRGELRPTRLDLRDCDRGDVANRNGRLVCNGGRGERGGSEPRWEPRYDQWNDGYARPPRW